MKSLIIAALVFFMVGGNISQAQKVTQLNKKSKRPNVVIVYADDLGSGDVSFMNKESKIPTPNIDALAAEGLSFTDAHSTSSICSPSRYGLLSGRYPWRTGLKSNPGVGAKHMIEPGRKTIATLFRDKGYDTACIGKWGLGADWSKAAKEGWKRTPNDNENFDFTAHIPIGETNGFTYDYVFLYFGKNANGRLWDAKYMEANSKGKKWKESTCWFYENGNADDAENVDFYNFTFGEAQMRTVERSIAYIDSKGSKSKDNNFNQQDDAPFFLYTALHVPHGPYFVDDQFLGKSEAGLFGDYVYQLDWSVGQIKEALKRNGLLENTIFIFTADNGVDGNQYHREKAYGHISRGKDWSGGKGKVFEGGHRIPFVISGLKDVKAGSVSNQMVSQVDFLATFTDMWGDQLGDNEGEDSYSFLPILKGDLKWSPTRNSMIHEGFFGGHRLALRHENWVYFQDAGEKKPEALYNLAEDTHQANNLLAKMPEKTAKMKAMLNAQIEAGRTR